MTWLADLYVAPPELARHAAALVVVGPLLASCAAVLSPNARWAWIIGVFGTAFSAWMALALAAGVARTGVVDYALGGFAPPLGIAFRIDAAGSLMALLVAGAGFATAVYSGHSLAAEARAQKRSLAQAGFLLSLSGMIGLVVTGDAFNAFVFLEVASVAVYALVGLGARQDRRALPAALNYLILGTMGATFFVLGVGFLYAATGTLNMTDIAARLPTLADSRGVQVGFALIVVGLGVKAAVFPLHGWLPAAYAQAPTMVSVFLSATATKAALYLLARFVFTVFGGDDAYVRVFLVYVLAPLGAAAALVGSTQAIFQSETRRVLAYSTVAHVGYIALGLSLASIAGLSAALLQILTHALTKAALFMVLGGAAMVRRGRTLADLAGMGRTAPWTSAALAAGAFGLIGVPLTGGFLSKWLLVSAAVSQGWMWAGGVVVLSSLLAVIYAGRLIEIVFFRPAPAGAEPIRDPPLGMLAPLWLLTLAMIWIGVDARLPASLARAGAAALLGAAP